MSRRTSVGNKVCRETILLEQRGERIDIALLITVGVALSVRGARSNAPGIVIGNIGDQTANRSRRSSSLVEVAKELCSRLNVGGPSEPASVTGIKVHNDILHVERLDGILRERLVGSRGIGALLDVGVGDQVGERVGLDD
jgi:hypothetical protein